SSLFPYTTLFRSAIDMLPDHVAETAGFLFLDLEPELGAFDGSLDLGAAANDALILQQAIDVARAVSRDLFWREIVEGFAEIVPLAQNGDPGQAGLESIQHQLFIQRAGIIFRHAPFLVMIGEIKRILARPPAPCLLCHLSS